MGRLLDALRAQKYGGGGNQTNLNNPSGDSCLGLLGTPPTLISENDLVPGESEPRVDSAIVEISSAVDPPVDPPDDAPDQYGHWSESEVLLCMERTRQFVRRGVPELIADTLACRLVERDRQEDTRRSCAECRAFRNGGCVQGKQPVCGGSVEVLHRCKTFIDPEVKHD